MNVDLYTNEFINLWENSKTVFPFSGEGISITEKKKNEERISNFLKVFRGKYKQKGQNSYEKARLTKQIKIQFGDFFKSMLNFTENEAAILEHGFGDATREFVLMARRFDPKVTIEDIFQACRNLWIINSLQIIMNCPVKVTPSIFAYSMLYPYSDNYLDDSDVSTEEKIAFSQRFRLRLEGKPVIATCVLEKNIFDLIALIEEDWDRTCHPDVYKGLLCIHDAQTQSIALQNDILELGYSDLLKICVEKGGSSVLADGYLIKGKLSADEERFCFGFGTYLQFVDDIQDLKEDLSDNLETLFTFGTAKNRIEEFVNRTVSFGDTLLYKMDSFSINNIDSMNSMMFKSVKFLLIEAIGLGKDLFTLDYVKAIENQSFFGFCFVQERRASMAKNRISLMKIMEEYIFDNEGIALKA